MKSKSYFLLLGALVSMLVNGFAYSQTDNENSVSSALTTILDYSKSKSYDKAAVLIAYSGNDNSRNGTDTYNPSDADELNQVKRICKKISALIDISDQYSINKIEAAKIRGSEGYKVVVGFKSGTQTLETVFEFVKLSKGYALLNLN